MIDKSIIIEQLLQQHPDSYDLLIEAGMHCIGCPVSQMESLEEACMVHGIDPDELIEKLNEKYKE